MRRFSLVFAVALIVALTVILSGCGTSETSLDGLSMVTFELEGGTFQIGTTHIDENKTLRYAYHPGTVVQDPTTFASASIYRADYVFTGWYTDESCTQSSKWNFNSYIGEDDITLYAGWKKAIKLTYTLYYFDDDNNQVTLGEYDVNTGDKFEDKYRLAKSRTGYTVLGFYSDPECTVAWDDTFTHPGTDSDLSVPVYVNYMKGIWTFVDTLDELCDAISDNANVQLTADIDCAGAALSFGDYSAELDGNGHTISNFKVEKSKRNTTYSCSIFTNLSDGAKISDLSFTGVTYDLSGVANATEIKLAALAVSSQGKGNIEVIVSNVTVSGNVVTDYTGELTKVNEFIYDVADNAVVEVTGNSDVNITVNANN